MVDAGKIISGMAQRYMGTEFPACLGVSMDGLIEGYGLRLGRGMGNSMETGPFRNSGSRFAGPCVAGIMYSKKGSFLSLLPLQKGLGLAIWK